MRMIHLTKIQARRFLLRHHGLLGEHIFAGKEGVLSFIKQCGCIQYDPIDVCGKNSELVLQSRVKGFTKSMLTEMLYTDRHLVDHFDKNMAIYPVTDWPFFTRERAKYDTLGRSHEEVNAAIETIYDLLKTHECITSREAGMDQKVDWYWSATTLSRAVLETLYFRGKLCIHHKQHTVKHYAKAEDLLPQEILSQPDPHTTEEDYRAFRILRRIGAVGLLWNKPSDAYLCIEGQKDGGRDAAFAQLIAQDALVQVLVEDIAEPLYARKTEEALLDEILMDTPYRPRMAFIAPLDCLLWDRKLIEKLFNFSYTWEIYTPVNKRKYGYYVLPIVCGDAFVGRIEVVADRKARILRVKAVWWENKSHEKELTQCLKRFAKFNDCASVERM